MKSFKALLLALLAGILTVSTAHAQATLYGVGDLTGDSTFFSQVRDATKVGGTIHAVGTSANRDNAGGDTGIYWTSSGGLTALPDLVTNSGGTSFITASAITPDAAYIAARARSASSGNPRQAVRYSTSSLSTPTDLLYAGLSATVPAYAVSISDNGNLLYGWSNNNIISGSQMTRYNVSSASADFIPMLAGKTFSIAVGRGASANGQLALGNASTFSGIPSATGTQAFVYDLSDNSVNAVPFLTGGTWNQGLAINKAGTVAVFAGDSTAYSGSSSEAFLYDGTTLTALGAPGLGLLPNIFGGINADGSVIGLDWSGTGGGSFIHNSSGWHSFDTVATLAGLNLAGTGWSNLGLNGISDDGTLVWGQGLHNGYSEGYVIEFSSGYLASVVPEPSTYAAFAGLGALGFAAWRRRRTAAA